MTPKISLSVGKTSAPQQEESEGLLEKGYDWYVQWVTPDSAALNSAEFNGVLADWKHKGLKRMGERGNVQAGEKPLAVKSGATVLSNGAGAAFIGRCSMVAPRDSRDRRTGCGRAHRYPREMGVGWCQSICGLLLVTECALFPAPADHGGMRRGEASISINGLERTRWPVRLRPTVLRPKLRCRHWLRNLA